ncbi:MAB_1171c family putative transporter [Kineosporia sp. R_H_3]|uniref:MAB_1171c family putative transporter n=1 Tax=Kineosporia sp. R_H_3 TaxID=1961848 RepID=UPI000B4AD7D2|nr:MAB_1171c family putative transporter [Kineosporia sp. R_H_3]
MVDDAVAFVAVLLWLTTAVESASVLRRRHREPALDMLLVTFGLLAITATFFVPAVHLAVGRVTGVANIGEPIARTALLGAAWSVQIMLHRLGDQGAAGLRFGRRGLVLGAFVVALWACFLAAPVDTPTARFTRDYGHEPAVAAYLVVSLAYLWLALIDVIRGTMRYGRAAQRPLALALRLIGLGCWLGLGYVAVKAVFVVMLVAGRGSADGGIESTISRLLAVAGGLLVIIGSALPYLAHRAGAARTWIVTYRNLQRLYRLWELMYCAEAGFALDPPGSRLVDVFRLRDLDLRLYRRVIEIRDGYLALAPYLPPGVSLPARPDDEQSEVLAILAAVANKREGRIAHAQPRSKPASSTLADDVDHLARVSRLLPRSPRHHLAVTARPAIGENPPSHPTPRTTT